MGRNFYLCPSEDGKDSFEDVEFDECDDSDYYHIGKSSCGWVFSFDLAFLQVWREKKDPRWKFAEVYWDRRSNGERCWKPCPAEPVYTITEDDVWEVLATAGYTIVDEYKCTHTLEEFQKVVRNRTRFNGEAPLCSYSYSLEKPEHQQDGNYRKHFAIGSLNFTPYTDFC